jgi:hypothetical protein
MDLLIDSALEEKNYHSGSQIARIITEPFAKRLPCEISEASHLC